MEVFDDTFIPQGLRDVWAGTHRCPRCIWPYLHPVASLDQARWLCPSCGHCWHIEHGRLRPVDPVMCHGCAAKSKRDCIELLQTEYPVFAAGIASDDTLT